MNQRVTCLVVPYPIPRSFRRRGGYCMISSSSLSDKGASMKPDHIDRENRRGLARREFALGASMKPDHIDRENY